MEQEKEIICTLIISESCGCREVGYLSGRNCKLLDRAPYASCIFAQQASRPPAKTKEGQASAQQAAAQNTEAATSGDPDGK